MALHTQGGADNWRFQSGAHKRRCTQQPVVERTERWQGNVWRFTHKAVHTQGGVHNRRFVATAGVLLCKRGCRGRLPRRAKRAVCQAEPAEAMEGLAVHTHGRLWPPLESGYFGGDAGAGPQVEESESFVHKPPVVCTALCIETPNLSLPRLASLNNRLAGISARASTRTPSQTKRLVRWLQPACCVRCLVCAPPCA